MIILIWIAAFIFTGASFADERGMTLAIADDHWSVVEGDPPYTVGEVRALYGEPDCVRTNEYSMDLVYSNSGIFFVCFSLESGSRISELVAEPPFKLKTADGFVLGESTKRDAERLWGKMGWYGRTDFPDYSFFRFNDARFLVPEFQKGFDKEVLFDRSVEKIMLFYSGLKRLEYEPPVPVEIKADALALKEKRGRPLDEYLKQAFVEELDLDLDAVNDPDWNPLWDNFANRPYEKQFNSLSNKEWFETRKRFESELLKRVEKDEKESLVRIFDSIRPESGNRTARVPVCAFRARKGTEPVWIIITKWEHAGQSTLMRLRPNWETLGDGEEKFEPGEKTWSSLGHIRIEAFRYSDGELVDAIQCG